MGPQKPPSAVRGQCLKDRSGLPKLLARVPQLTILFNISGLESRRQAVIIHHVPHLGSSFNTYIHMYMYYVQVVYMYIHT